MRIVILEDDEPRRAAMRARLSDRFPQYAVDVFATAAETIRHLQAHLGETLVIALDHDLDTIEGGDHARFDPGTGRDVVDYLAEVEPACPVIVHTTNAPAAVGMIERLREAGWTTRRVRPVDDLAWIDDDWFPALRKAIVSTARREATADA